MHHLFHPDAVVLVNHCCFRRPVGRHFHRGQGLGNIPIGLSEHLLREHGDQALIGGRLKLDHLHPMPQGVQHAGWQGHHIPGPQGNPAQHFLHGAAQFLFPGAQGFWQGAHQFTVQFGRHRPIRVVAPLAQNPIESPIDVTAHFLVGGDPLLQRLAQRRLPGLGGNRPGGFGLGFFSLAVLSSAAFFPARIFHRIRVQPRHQDTGAIGPGGRVHGKHHIGFPFFAMHLQIEIAVNLVGEGVQHFQQQRRFLPVADDGHRKHAEGIGQIGGAGIPAHPGDAPGLDPGVPDFPPPGLGDDAGFQLERPIAGNDGGAHAAGGPVDQGKGFIFESLDDFLALEQLVLGAHPPVHPAIGAPLPMHQFLVRDHGIAAVVPFLPPPPFGQQKDMIGALLIEVGGQASQQPSRWGVPAQPRHFQQQGVVRALDGKGRRRGRKPGLGEGGSHGELNGFERREVPGHEGL